MAQHDYVIDNQSFPATRADINNVLQAIASNNSGASAPSTTYANQFWYETDTNKLYIRNEDNDAWIEVAVLDQANDIVSSITSETLVANIVNERTSGSGVTVDGLLIKDKEIGTTAAPATLQASAINGGQIGGRRNLITNGAMNVAQRGTSAVNASSSGTYRIDRFKGFASGGGVFTMEQSSTVPNNTFSNSTKLTVTTADSSIASGDYYAFNTDIEGYDIIRTAYGTSDAQTLTLSFWVRSSVTGTYSVTAYNSDGSRGYLNTFSIGSADTWTKVSLSWAGDTGGTWNKTNGKGITLRWDMGGGSSGHGTANQWTTSGAFAANSTSGSVQWIATNSATFYLTGVQLEVGSVATEFEHRSFGEDLALCQRYFQTFAAAVGRTSSGSPFGTFDIRPNMRAQPSATRLDNAVSSQEAGTTVTPSFANASALAAEAIQKVFYFNDTGNDSAGGVGTLDAEL